MNFLYKDIDEYISFFKEFKITNNTNIILCPSNIYLKHVIDKMKNNKIDICSQNVSNNDFGSFTGEVSCTMLKDIGCNWSIIGHSERRIYYKESNELIKSKLSVMFKEEMSIILCIGESLEERESGKTNDVLAEQLSILSGYENFYNLVIAYEPVWAIGSGKVASENIIYKNHVQIRKILNDLGFEGNKLSLLYGGSVNEKNANNLAQIDEIDGFLVGSASLDFNKFYTIFKTL